MPALRTLTVGGIGWRCLCAGLTALTLTLIINDVAWCQSSNPRTTNSTRANSKKGAAETTNQGLLRLASRNFSLMTDLPPDEAKELLQRLETILVQVGKYWGKPNSQLIEMYVVKDLSKWSEVPFPADALQSVQTGGGLTKSQTLAAVDRATGRKTAHLGTKSVVYAVADRGTPLHEAVHAYCAQTFGTTGPTWFSEGIAELGQYWRDKDTSVQIHPGVLEYLQQSDPVQLTEIVDLSQRTGDSWQNYAWRWALCHMLAFNPNYAARFRPLGLDLLREGDQSFQSVYGSMAQEISFEYLQFLEHLDNGYRVDLCSWDWKTKAVGVRGKSTVQGKIEAGRGWQPSRLLAKAGETYEFTADGEWQLAADDAKVNADGDRDGSGRLIGVLFTDYALSDPFELGVSGRWTAPSDGTVFLRCRDDWNSLADNTGTITVKFKASE